MALALNVSPAAYLAYRRGGWTDLGTVPLYVRPLRLTEALDAAEMTRESVRALGRRRRRAAPPPRPRPRGRGPGGRL